MEENKTQTTSVIEQAKAEIEEALKKHNVTLVPTIVHQGDRTFSRIDIIPGPGAEVAEEGNG